MRPGQLIAFASTLVLAIAVIPAHANPRIHRGPTSPRLFKPRAAAPKPKATAQIDAARSTQIQTALIKSGYLTGTPSGVWDAQTQTAMEKLQADNGWQTKLVPDSRAIIKLGLGPNTAPAGEMATTFTDAPETPAVSSDSMVATPSNK